MKFLHTLKPMFWTRALLALALVASTAPVLADAEAAPRASSTSIEWSLGSAERATVTVSHPDGKVTRHEFEAGSAPRFSAFDAQGQTLPDGVYSYEVVGSPGLRPNLRKRVDSAPSEEAAAEIVARSPRGYVRSGTFQIRGGFISLPEPGTGLGGRLDKGAATEDQVIPDDLIVQGSGCFGFDCVNNESFGFDTIRLKENNLRIKFDDTSVGTFPANDWQLTANDSASGGASKFSIEDITGSRVPFTITAGASTNSIFVDSTGRMGLKTSTPVLDVHINTSNTPAIRMEQNNSGGFTAQTWDIGANEANWFVRDVTGGSKLSLRIRPGAPTSSIDISSDGDVGIGTGSPENKLHVFGSATSDVFMGLGPNPDGSPGTESALNIGYAGASNGRAAGFINIRPDSGAAAPNPSLRFLVANTERMIIDNQGFIGLGVADPTSPIHHSSGAFLSAGGTWQSVSTRAAKHDVHSLTPEAALAAFSTLEPVFFTYNAEPGREYLGFIAEDVPAIVASPDRKTLNAMDVVALLTKVVQEQEKAIAELAAKIQRLESAGH